MAKRMKQEEFDDQGKLGPCGEQAEKVLKLRIKASELKEDLESEENTMLDIMEKEGHKKFVFKGNTFSETITKAKRSLKVSAKANK